MKQTIAVAAGRLERGDEFTIAGVYEPATRSRWRRFVDRLLRRPDPPRRLRVFRITGDAGS